MAGNGAAGRLERRHAREARPAQLRWIAQARSLGAALDLLPNALMLMQPCPPRIWHANLAARQLLRDAGVLRLIGDQLAVADDATHARIEALLGRCLHDGGCRFELQMPHDQSGRELTLRVQALEFGAGADLPVRQLVLAEVYVRGSADTVIGDLSREFGLTRKEAEAALRLHATGSVADIAALAHRSVHTVRTQLKTAMSKTSTRSQAGLVALVGDRLSGRCRPPEPSTPRGR